MNEENKTVFDLNDRVSAFGVEGVVISIEAVDYYPIKVNDYYPIKVKFANGQCKVFTTDGKYESWHLEPSLKLIEKAKRKVKKKFWIIISDLEIQRKYTVTKIYEMQPPIITSDCQSAEIELEVEE